MPTTAKGAPFPAATSANDVPADLQALANWLDARPGVSPLTTAARDALIGADLWDGRVIYNLTTAQLERYNAAIPAWQSASISDHGLLTGLADDDHPQYVLHTEGDATYVRRAGGDTIVASGAGVTPLVVKGASGQTVSLFEARNAANELRTFVTAGGGLVTRGLLVAGPVDNDGSAQALLVTQDPARRALTVRGAASQTVNLAEFQNSAGTVLASVLADGRVSAFFAANNATRILELGAADSAGVGFRTVRVAN
jgi:hypothetical protein